MPRMTSKGVQCVILPKENPVSPRRQVSRSPIKKRPSPKPEPKKVFADASSLTDSSSYLLFACNIFMLELADQVNMERKAQIIA